MRLWKGLINLIPQDKIQQARQTDLVQFLQSRGVQLKRIGKEWQHPEHSSLYIQGNHYTWFAEGVTREKDEDGRNAITLVMKLYGWSFQKAVQELTGFIPANVQSAWKSSTPKKTYVPNAKRAIAYLNQRRGIDYSIIKQLLTTGRLKQDNNGNCCFIVKDFDGNTICSDMHGTGDERFKGISSSQQDFGFAVGCNSPKFIIFFESSIDLLSFIQLVKTNILYLGNEISLDNSLLVSMIGLKINVVRKYMQHYSNSQFVIAVDNDKAGQFFQNTLAHEDFAERIGGIFVPPKKDWNETLLAGLEKKKVG